MQRSKPILFLLVLFAFALAVDVARGQITLSTAKQTVTGTNILPAIADPGSPSTGELWLSTTDADTLKFRSGGTTHSLATLADVSTGYQPLDATLTSISALSGPASQSFTYSSNGDTAGVVYFLGTAQGTATWTNPHTAGFVVVVMSSTSGSSSASKMVDRTSQDNGTTSNGWISIDLGSARTLVPNKYSIRHGYSSGFYPRNWKLQGSNNAASNSTGDLAAATWTDLDTRAGDTTIASAYAWGSFTVTGVTTPYRWLRIVSTGVDTNGSTELNLCEFEFYGTLAYTGAVPSGLMAYTLGTDSVSTVNTSAGLAGQLSDETGTGAAVFATSPTLVTPTLGVASATSINKVAITAPATSATLTIANGKTLTASNTLTFTGTDASSVAFGAGGTVAYTADKLSAFASTTSSEFAGVISDETGTGKVVLDTSPTLVTPALGVASATSINKVAVTAPATSATLTIADGKTLTASNTLTFTGTDASSVAFGAGGTVAYTANKLSAFASTTSSEFAGVISDETGTGKVVLDTSPTLVTPTLGAASATSLALTGNLTTADGFTVSSAGSIALTAAGTNENVTLTPSGTGKVWIGSGTNVATNGVVSWGATANQGSLSWDTGRAIVNADTGNHLDFTQTTGSTRMRIVNSNGNVLVGTTTDSSNGKIQLPDHTASSGGIGFGSDTSAYRSAAGTVTFRRVTGGTAREVRLLADGGGVEVKASVGGWSTGYRAVGSGGTALGGFGAYGTDDTLTHLWIGTEYNTAGIKVLPSTSKVEIPYNTASTSTTTGALTIVGGVGIQGSLYSTFGSFNRSSGSSNDAAILATHTTTAALTDSFGVDGRALSGHSSGIQTNLTGVRGLARNNVAQAVSTLIGVQGQADNPGGGTVTNAHGFYAPDLTLTATNRYGFRGQVSSGTGKYNLYMDGTAANRLAGETSITATTEATTGGAGALTVSGGIYSAKKVVAMGGLVVDKTVTGAGTTGAQTINKPAGTVNFAAAATSLVVTNSLVTTSSIIICTVGTNDTTMHSVQAVAGSGSFTLYPNAAPTAETRVNFHIIN